MKHYHEEEIPIEEDFNPWDEKERAVLKICLSVNPFTGICSWNLTG